MLTLRLREAEREMIVKQSRAAGKDVSVWVRERLLE